MVGECSLSTEMLVIISRVESHILIIESLRVIIISIKYLKSSIRTLGVSALKLSEICSEGE